MGVGQLSESDAVDDLRLPFYSSSHPTGHMVGGISLIWAIPTNINLFVHVVPDQIFEVAEFSVRDEYRCLDHAWFVIVCTVPDVE